MEKMGNDDAVISKRSMDWKFSGFEMDLSLCPGASVSISVPLVEG